MTIDDLMPWNRGHRLVPARRREDAPLGEFRRHIDNVFEDFWRSAPFGRFEGGLEAASPRTDIAESESEIEITLELPGIDENHIDVSLTDDVLTIAGEKNVAREEKSKDYCLTERSSGSFRRSISLPRGLDTGKARAEFKRGVLTVTLPKSAEAKDRVKRIAVKAA